MKIKLSQSILLNVMLFGMCVYLGSQRRTERPGLAASFGAEAAKITEPVLEQTPVVTEVVRSKRWSELESRDYATFAQNLREFGTPERSVRAVIGVEVTSQFDELRAQARAENSAPSAQQQRLEAIRREENELLQSLFGPPATVQVTAPTAREIAEQTLATPSKTQTPSEPIAEGPPSLPLALLDPSSNVELSDEQAEAWSNLREQFIQTIGGENQNPADPNYRQRWQEAQPELDERFKAVMGWEIFNQQQSKAAADEVVAGTN